MEPLFPIWVVYDHPKDYPDWFIVRRQVPHTDGSIVNDTKAFGFRELANARAWLEEQGLVPIPRYVEDDPVIVEIWV